MKYGLLLCIIVFLVGCKNSDDYCDSILPPLEIFSLSFEDANGNNLLGTEGYIADEMVLFRGEFEDLPQELNEEFVTFSYFQLMSDTDYYLRLNEIDTDTIRAIIIIEDTRCGDLRKIDRFLYNGVAQPVESNEPLFTITKN